MKKRVTFKTKLKNLIDESGILKVDSLESAPLGATICFHDINTQEKFFLRRDTWKDCYIVMLESLYEMKGKSDEKSCN